MAPRSFTLTALISTENPRAIRSVLNVVVPKGRIVKADKGFLVTAIMRGKEARELNRTLLSSLRRVERRTRLRSEWKSGDTVEKFFDYVPKGLRKV